MFEDPLGGKANTGTNKFIGVTRWTWTKKWIALQEQGEKREKGGGAVWSVGKTAENKWNVSPKDFLMLLVWIIT